MRTEHSLAFAVWFSCFQVVCCMVLAVGLSARVVAQEGKEERRPNVILIMTDDQGIGDLGVMGNRVLETPNLDHFASQSAQLKYFYVHPVCAPTRACLMTGRYNYRTRAIDAFVGRAMMEPAETTIAEVMKPAGYRTGIFGKWHLGDCYPMRPMDQGFDTSVVHQGGGIGQPSDPPEGVRKYTDPILFRSGTPEQFKGYCTDVYYDEAMKFIDESTENKQPFFAYIPDNTPHGPFHDVPMDLYEHYKSKNVSAESFGETIGRPFGKVDPDFLARVYAMIGNVDRNVGRLLDKLDKSGLADNTIVIFMCDNGPNSDRYKMGLRGTKSSVYEGGIRSPFIIRWPKKIAAGRIQPVLSAHIDVLPTIMGLCGVQPPANLKMDGVDLSSQFLNRSGDSPKRRLFIQSHRGNQPIANHHVAILAAEQDVDDIRHRWKLVNASGFGREVFDDEVRYELFDLNADPFEQNDLAAQNPTVVKEMRAAYDKWFKDVSSTRADNYAPPRIVITPKQTQPTVLTRQDWRRADKNGWGRQGKWLIRVEKPCIVNVVCSVRPSTKAKSMSLLLGDGQELCVDGKLQTDQQSIVFESVELPQGEYSISFDALVEFQKRGEKNPVEAVEGAYQASIEFAK